MLQDNFAKTGALLHWALSLVVQCIVIGPVCDSGVCNGQAGGVQTLLQPACMQCLRLSERFFHCYWNAFISFFLDLMFEKMTRLSNVSNRSNNDEFTSK